MGFIHDPTWQQILGLAALFTAIVGVLEAFRGQVVVSRFSDSATVLSSALLLMWLAAAVTVLTCLGPMAGLVTAIASVAVGVGFMRVAMAVGGAAGMTFASKATTQSAAEEARAILVALNDANVQLVLDEFNLTHSNLRELYEELVQVGLGEAAAESALTDAQFLRAYFGRTTSTDARRQELQQWLSRLEKAA